MNIVEPERPQLIIWRMRISRRVPKATDTHSECVILFVFSIATMVARTPLSAVLCILCLSCFNYWGCINIQGDVQRCKSRETSLCTGGRALTVLILWSRVSLQEAMLSQLVKKKLPAFYGSGRFIIVFKGSATPSWPEPDQSSLHCPIHLIRCVTLLEDI